MDREKKNYTYILSCGDGSLYTGWTDDLRGRVKTHREGAGAKYTRTRRPVQLAYYEVWDTRREAMRREWEIKRLTHREKQELMAAGTLDGEGIPRTVHAGKLTAKSLTIAEMRDIYHRYMEGDFPESELKPLAAMVKMYRDGHYEPWGFFEDGKLMAYAYFVTLKGHSFVLLDYFAVISELRDRGVGSRCLAAMGEVLGEGRIIFMESERTDEAVSEEDKVIRENRQRFYIKNGAVMTDLYPRIFGVGYRLLIYSRGEPLPEADIQENVEVLYRLMFPAEHYDEIVEWK